MENKNNQLKINRNSEQDKKIQAEANALAMKAIQPVLDENIRLQKIIEKHKENFEILESRIRELETEIDELPRKLSPSSRDNPMSPKYRDEDPVTDWYCPICDSRVSNWENYCLHCGQRLGERTYDPSLRKK